MSNKNHKIGIIGVGMVGGAVQRYLKEVKKIKPYLYDTGKKLGSLEDVNKANIVFVCVPTPYDESKGGYDFSYVEDACSKLEGDHPSPEAPKGRGKIVVIKSTVVPGTTEALQEKFPQHKFLFNPEFLVEARADETMQKPDRQIMGCTEKSKDVAEEVLNILPDAPYKKIIPSGEAEMVKYFGNTFLATKVVFANHMYDLCEKLNLDYSIVADGAGADPRVTSSHLDVFHGGFRGYGGSCFPKDIRALIQFADSVGIDLHIHKKAEEINRRLLRGQNIDS